MDKTANGAIKEHSPPLFLTPASADKNEILILSVPLTVTNSAWAAGAVLKSIAVDVGYYE